MYKTVGISSKQQQKSALTLTYQWKQKEKGKNKWITKDCFSDIKKKHKAWRKYTDNKTVNTYECYCQVRNMCTRTIRNAKKNFERNFAVSIKTNPKEFSGYVKERTKVKPTVADLVDETGELISDKELKANLLNDFFASVVTTEPDGSLPVLNVRHQGIPITKLMVTTDEVNRQLMHLNISKSVEPDMCHPRLLKKCATVISEPLQVIFNKTFNKGVPNQ